jgi:hypothetical protein
MLVLGKIALGMAAATVGATGLLCSEGFVNVKVVGHGHDHEHVHVIAPAILAPIIVRVAPVAQLNHAADKLDPWLPTVRAALDGLDNAPDMTLVEVSDPDDFVQVTKSDGSVVVDVANRDQSVHVSAPLRAIGSTVEALASRSDGSQTEAASF